MTTTAWLSGASAASVDSPQPDDVTWSNPSNALADGGSVAGVSLDSTEGLYYSYFLAAYNFTTGLPAGSTVNGVEIIVDCIVTGALILEEARVYVYLAKTASSSSSDYALYGWQDAPTGDYAELTFGSPSTIPVGWDLSDFTSSGFGVWVQAYTTNSATDAVFVDNIKIRITYTEAGGGGGAQVILIGA